MPRLRSWDACSNLSSEEHCDYANLREVQLILRQFKLLLQHGKDRAGEEGGLGSLRKLQRSGRTPSPSAAHVGGLLGVQRKPWPVRISVSNVPQAASPPSTDRLK